MSGAISALPLVVTASHSIVHKNKFTFTPAYQLQAEIPQPLWRLAMGRTTDGSDFEYQYGQEFYLLLVIQTGSGVHPHHIQWELGGPFSLYKVAMA